MPMADPIVVIAGACTILAFLVYLMWREATRPAWGTLTQTEKKRWRVDEEKRKEAKGG